MWGVAGVYCGVGAACGKGSHTAAMPAQWKVALKAVKSVHSRTQVHSQRKRSSVSEGVMKVGVVVVG